MSCQPCHLHCFFTLHRLHIRSTEVCCFPYCGFNGNVSKSRRLILLSALSSALLDHFPAFGHNLRGERKVVRLEQNLDKALKLMQQSLNKACNKLSGGEEVLV